MITFTKSTCPHCNGTGFQNLRDRVVLAPNTRTQIVLRLRECEPCDGSGEMVEPDFKVKGKRNASIAK